MNGFIIVCSVALPISSEPLKNGAVAVCGGIIKAVGKAGEIKKHFPSLPVHDLGCGILMPGFVNCHTHLELGWLAPENEFKNFGDWLKYVVDAKKSGTTAEKIADSVKDGVATLLKSGVTTVGEISSYGEDTKILKNSPLRTVLFREITDTKADLSPLCAIGKRFEERFFPHAPYSCSPELTKRVLEISARTGAPTGTHLAESPEETAFVRGEENIFEKEIYLEIGRCPMPRARAKTPLSYFHKINSGKTKTTAVHMAHVEKNEIKLIRDSNMGIVLCPRSNKFLNTGTAPVTQYAEFERTGLGTDGLSSNRTLNFFDEIKALNELLLPLGKEKAAQKAVYISTLGGAKSLFIEDKTGSIEAGKDADLIFIKTRSDTGNPYLKIVSANGAETVSRGKK